MRVALAGTPGTGKTTAADRVETDLDVVHLNRLVEAEGLTSGVDADRGSWIADLEAVGERLAGRDDVLVESHFAHRLDVDRVVVLRCAPAELKVRLRERGEPEATVEENAEAEALDLVLAEAVAEHGEDAVYEIDTTDRPPAAVARAVEAAVAGDREPAAGTVSFADYLAP
ncbi:MAG: adenylate kinase family protein [Halobacteriales archaeon]